MEIMLTPELEAALSESARKQGVSPQDLALEALRQHFLVDATLPAPADEWERNVLKLGKNCGVSLPHSALSSEGL